MKRRGAGLPSPPIAATLQAGVRPLAVHTIGLGARVEDALFDHPIVGWFRFPPARG